MDRLQTLVFSFYREDPLIEVALVPLLKCKMSRSWGSIRVECLDVKHLEEVCDLLDYLRKPFSELGIGRAIVLRVPGSTQRIFPMKSSTISDLLS